MTTLGWLRSRRTISSNDRSKCSPIRGESASIHDARVSSYTISPSSSQKSSWSSRATPAMKRTVLNPEALAYTRSWRTSAASCGTIWPIG